METFELRYFLGVAKTQNIHEASEDLHVSPGSLSKAISRLEDELSVKLFTREGRGIRLTEQGRLLQIRASEIIQLEEAAKLELSGVKGTIQIKIAGSEILLTNWAMKFCRTLKQQFPLARFEFIGTDDKSALSMVETGEVHLAIVTNIANKNLVSKSIGETEFKTYVGKSHPLAGRRKAVEVNEVLEHAFVGPNHSFLGKVGTHQSLDGWRDDQFPRKIEFLTSSLKLLEEIVVSGEAIAYLPEYFGEKLNLEILRVSGCPYTCKQKIKIVARNPKDHSWMNWVFK